MKNIINGFRLNKGVSEKKKTTSPKPINLSIGLTNSFDLNEKYRTRPTILIKIKIKLFRIKIKLNSTEK